MLSCCSLPKTHQRAKSSSWSELLLGASCFTICSEKPTQWTRCPSLTLKSLFCCWQHKVSCLYTSDRHLLEQSRDILRMTCLSTRYNFLRCSSPTYALRCRPSTNSKRKWPIRSWILRTLCLKRACSKCWREILCKRICLGSSLLSKQELLLLLMILKRCWEWATSFLSSGHSTRNTVLAILRLLTMSSEPISTSKISSTMRCKRLSVYQVFLMLSERESYKRRWEQTLRQLKTRRTKLKSKTSWKRCHQRSKTSTKRFVR